MMVVRATRMCEAIHETGIAQPVNTWTNLFYIAAAVGLLYYFGKTKKLISGDSTYNYLFIFCVALIGVCSFLGHATLTAWGGAADFESMYMLVTLTTLLGVSWLWPIPKKWLLTIWILINIPLTFVAGQSGRITDYTFMAWIFLIIALEIAAQVKTTQRAKGYFWWGIATMAVAYFLWQMDVRKIWCNPNSLWQVHGVWHLLTAIAAGLLYLYLANKSPRLSSGQEKS